MEYYWTVLNTIQNLFFPLSFLVNIKIPRKFSLNTESLVAILTYYPTSFLFTLYFNRHDNSCMSILLSRYVFSDIRNLINIVFIVLYPIYLGRTNKFHFLPSSKQKNDYIVFLLEKQLYNVFSAFILDRKSQNEENPDKYQNYQWSLVFLDYFRLVQILFNEKDSRKIEVTKQ